MYYVTVYEGWESWNDTKVFEGTLEECLQFVDHDLHTDNYWIYDPDGEIYDEFGSWGAEEI